MPPLTNAYLRADRLIPPNPIRWLKNAKVRSVDNDVLNDKLDRIVEKIDMIEYCLNGNGVPGLKTRLDRLEQSRAFWVLVAGLLIPSMVAAMVDIYLKVFLK